MDEYNIYEGAWSGPVIDQAIGRVYASGNSGALASAADLTNIQATSPTNTTGSAISNGTYFYLDGVLVRAKANIASGATFTSSNYETVTAGGLNTLMVKGYSTTGLSPASGVTLEEGGYYRVGTLVVFCVRLSTTNEMSAGALLTGLPGYNTISTAIVACANNRKLDINIQKSGTLYCYDTIPAGALLVSATYIAT